MKEENTRTTLCESKFDPGTQNTEELHIISIIVCSKNEQVSRVCGPWCVNITRRDVCLNNWWAEGLTLGVNLNS